ncbi:DUF3231 family protein [Bacillus andreraoultii]|uniref:DUF3231 family protein n=1 Tax=Bacillus andreraoultii TaxID=1499685 RepID=UPI000B06DB26|nr:DUF3231 family protein [Bacillus andreraoultii]
MKKLKENRHVKLTAAELGYLWQSYMGDTMSICIFQYFLKHIEDRPIKTLMQHALDVSQQHVEQMKKIFRKEGVQVPIGFTEEDINLNVGRLFSDIYYLRYIDQTTKGGIAAYSRLMQQIFRDDIRSFYKKCMQSTIELSDEATKLLLEKGIASRQPVITYPDRVEFIKKQSFMLEGLGKRNNLSSIEIAQLYYNIETNYLGTSLALAFSQVSKSEKVRKFFLRGKEIAMKHIKIFREYLENSSLPAPISFEQEVMSSTEAPFSEKLMMYHFSLMIYQGISNYGISMANCQRSDLVVDFSRLIVEVLKYSEDGFNIMIGNGWLEQPPMSIDRKNLVKE